MYGETLGKQTNNNNKEKNFNITFWAFATNAAQLFSSILDFTLCKF